jgi:hypothetical protein
MEYIDHLRKAHGVDGPESIALEIVDDLETARPPNPLSALAETGSPPL